MDIKNLIIDNGNSLLPNDLDASLSNNEELSNAMMSAAT